MIAAPTTAGAPLIALRGVTKSYPGAAGAFTAIDDVSLTIAQGELRSATVVLLGTGGKERPDTRAHRHEIERAGNRYRIDRRGAPSGRRQCRRESHRER